MGANPSDQVDIVMGELEKLKKEFGTGPEMPGPAASGMDDLGMESTLAMIPAEENEEPGLLDAATQAMSNDRVSDFDPQARVNQVEEEMSAKQNHLKLIDSIITDSPESSPNVSGDQLTLSVSGPTQLHLKYEFSGQSVTVGFENDCLVVRLGDGSEFRVPAKRGARSNAA